MFLKALKRFVKNYFRKKEIDSCENFSRNCNFVTIKQPLVLKRRPHSIVFVLPGVDIYGGGVNSVMNLANGLSENGYDVYISSLKDESDEDISKKILFCIGNSRVKGVSKINFQKNIFDIVVATAWETACYIFDYPGYKMYFVQDYEPYFYEKGDLYYLSYKSYGLGYHMISLGGWNKKQILKEYPCAKVDEISFPFDGKYYKKTERASINRNNEINAAVYLRYTARRLPYLTEIICRNLIAMFAADGYKLNVYYFGDDKKIRITGGTNLGKLNKKELVDLYSKCDFGMVFSYTNISLVPYEMMATGLPLVELKEGTFTEFMPENAAVLYDGNVKNLYPELKKRIFDKQYFNAISESNINFIKNFTWEKTIKGFVSILEKLNSVDDIS